MKGQCTKETGRFITDYICDFGGRINKQLRSRVSDGRLVVNSLQSNGHEFSITFINTEKAKLSKWDLKISTVLTEVELLASRSVDVPSQVSSKSSFAPSHNDNCHRDLNKQQTADLELLTAIKERRPKIFSCTGLDSGERYPLAWSTIRNDLTVGFGSASRDCYYNQVMLRT
jgi:hypothetical protein